MTRPAWAAPVDVNALADALARRYPLNALIAALMQRADDVFVSARCEARVSVDDARRESSLRR